MTGGESPFLSSVIFSSRFSVFWIRGVACPPKTDPS